jgi:hypothetical protein
VSAYSPAAAKRYRAKYRDVLLAKSRADRASWTPEQHAARLEYRREWYRRNRDRMRAYMAARKYGITVDDYTRMREAQNGCCAICKRPDGRRRLAVDHDHVTKKVRALLCGPCNVTLGMMRDDPQLLRAAADYLESFR